MHILVTNDDGVQSPGLLALVQAVRPLGRISIVAPDRNWSGAGHTKTLDRPLQVKETALCDGTPALSCEGAPSDCVALALMGLLEEPVNLVVSGINPYPNLGFDITYSGTVTNVMEASIWGVPGIAFSIDGFNVPRDRLDYEPAVKIARRVIEIALREALAPQVLLNVNIPCLTEEKLMGYRITRLGKRIYRDELFRYKDPWGRPYYWIGGKPPTGVAEPDTDIGALEQGYVSITPLQLDMTAYQMMDVLRDWDFSG